MYWSIFGSMIFNILTSDPFLSSWGFILDNVNWKILFKLFVYTFIYKASLHIKTQNLIYGKYSKKELKILHFYNCKKKSVESYLEIV